MIIKCEKCESEFNLNESLLKKDGSSVRCSVCRNVFKVFPPEPDFFEEPLDEFFSNAALEETVALDGIEPESLEEDKEYSFDMAFEDAIEKVTEDDEFIASDDEPISDEEEDNDEFLLEKTDTAANRINATKKKRKDRSRLLLVSLLIILLLSITALVIFFFAPGVLPDSFSSLKPATQESLTDSGIDRLAFEGVNGSFIKSDNAGQIYIIKGSVINNYLKPRSFILLKGAILDGQGNPIKQETAYAGNTLTDKQLKENSWDDIIKVMKNQTGMDNNNVNIKQGSAVPFMILFRDLPDNSNELAVEAISSSPGK